MISHVCYRKKTFRVVYEKNPSGFAFRLKGGVGVCLGLNDQSLNVYCFMGFHLDTEPKDGAERIVQLLNQMDERTMLYNVMVYGLGDWNLRAALKTPFAKGDEKKVEDALKQSTSFVKEGNDITENIFKQRFSESIKKLSKKAYSLSFPQSNLFSLPITYKYNKNEYDSTGRISKPGDYDYEGIVSTKSIDGDLKGNNLGWLDRLGCVYSNAFSDCRIRSINYYAAKEAMVGDHLPLSGYFYFRTL